MVTTDKGVRAAGPHAREVYVPFPAVAPLAASLVLARVVRAEPDGGGGYLVRARFVR